MERPEIVSVTKASDEQVIQAYIKTTHELNTIVKIPGHWY